MIYAVSFKHKIPADSIVLDVTSRSNNWTKLLSPFNVGPVTLYDEHVAFNIENGYQFSKIYEPYHCTATDLPSDHYWEWAKAGWRNPKPIKYPLGAWTKCFYHWWDGKKLDHLQAQNQIFLPLYKKAITKTSAFQRLKEMYETTNKDIYLLDFEGYDHRYLEQNWDQIISNPNRPVGQAFALCMLLEGYL